jgi:hypothetical protein
MNTQEVLNTQITKTAKIRLLTQLGHSIKDIAQMIGSNTGFVYGVLHYRQAPETLSAATAQMPLVFNRKFGIEIEAFNVERNALVEKLRMNGIEVENEGYNHSTRPHWKVIGDSSIRGEKAFELVSPPLVGEEGLREVEIVCRVLKQMNAKINKTCGLHVHIEAKDFKIGQWRNIFKNYVLFEDAIDAFMPMSRRSGQNKYCQSIKGRRAISSIFSDIDSCKTVKQIEKKVTNKSRYYKINAQAFARHGTIEFRQHSGTVEFLKINNWVRFLHNLICYSQSNVAADGNFERLADFNQPELMAYFNERKEELNQN